MQDRGRKVFTRSAAECGCEKFVHPQGRSAAQAGPCTQDDAGHNRKARRENETGSRPQAGPLHRRRRFHIVARVASNEGRPPDVGGRPRRILVPDARGCRGDCAGATQAREGLVSRQHWVILLAWDSVGQTGSDLY